MANQLLGDGSRAWWKVNPVVLILAVVILLPALLFGGYTAKCKLDQYSLKNANKDEISAFESIKLASFDTSETVSYTGGDCVDSLPYVSMRKQMYFDKNASEALADIKQTLASQGFTLSEEKIIHKSGIKSADCGYEYKAQATSSKIDFSLFFFTYDYNAGRSAECASTGDSPVTEAALMNVKAKMVSANNAIETVR